MKIAKKLCLFAVMAQISCLPVQAKTTMELILEGEAAYAANDLKAAKIALDAALVEAEKTPENKEEMARTLNDLGVVEDELGNYDQAVTNYQKVLKLISDKPDTRDQATALNNLANVFKDQQKYDQAEPLYKQVIGIYERTTGAQSEYIAMSNHNLASLYAQMGKFKEAEAHFKIALAAGEKSMGADNTHVIDIVVKLARVKDKLGNRDEAKLLFKRYLTKVESMIGLKSDDPNRIEKLKALAAELKKNGQAANAELIEKAISYDESESPK